MAFISGTQRDTRTEPALVLRTVGHMLPRMLTGPSYSSASEEISIFCMMSFSRLCCFSSRRDISFILEKRVGGSERWHTIRFVFFPHALVTARLQPLGAAHASQTTATYRLGHSAGLRLYITNKAENVIPACTIGSLPVLLLLELRLHQRAPLCLSLHATPHFVLLI